MLFEKILEFIYNSPLMNILIFICVICFCVKTYKNAIESRKYYKCSNCGEIFRSEHSDAKVCQVCGSELIEINKENYPN